MKWWASQITDYGNKDRLRAFRIEFQVSSSYIFNIFYNDIYPYT